MVGVWGWLGLGVDCIWVCGDFIIGEKIHLAD